MVDNLEVKPRLKQEIRFGDASEDPRRRYIQRQQQRYSHRDLGTQTINVHFENDEGKTSRSLCLETRSTSDEIMLGNWFRHVYFWRRHYLCPSCRCETPWSDG